ncbi:hypothetical protein [Pseudomonas chlororaphis]|uniref:hypothetical protein n=1 Tax=Pseudomonas chlororaphis TaxID=587753 RepID=UPI001473BB2E|nr:hypothetical protein [Pseudomonas chlororaphis]NNB47062.1 hypothetical protein [Pseudomonas chlororaphis]
MTDSESQVKTAVCLLQKYKQQLDGPLWEKYCEHLLRKEYGFKEFTSVPAEDRGDHGIEFFTSDGTIYQCYFPKPDYSMAEYKKKINKKISDDLAKLEEYKVEIGKLIGDLKITHWILMIPEIKSRDLIKKCKLKEKEVRKKNIDFIDPQFQVKLETDESFPESALAARHLVLDTVDLEVNPVSHVDIELWVNSNSVFHENLKRKSTNILKERATESFKEEQVKKYIQLNELLDYYRAVFPQIETDILIKAIESLDHIQNDFYYCGLSPQEAIRDLLKLNRNSFQNSNHNISTRNIELLATGHLAKWLAECNLEFIING